MIYYRGTTGASRTLDRYFTLKALLCWQSACLPTTRTIVLRKKFVRRKIALR
jgi:hypothetical protein